MSDRNQDFEQEINLGEYLAVLIKRKKLILSVVFVFVVATAVTSFRMPRIWDISMIVEPSIFSDTGRLSNTTVLLEVIPKFPLGI